MTYEDAKKLIAKRFPESKVISCSETTKKFIFAIVPIDAEPVKRHESVFYNYFDNQWELDKQTNAFSRPSMAPEDVFKRFESGEKAKLIYSELPIPPDDDEEEEEF